ncbi:hypothetical protein BD560DRAFT_428590 [Blakeslea trispora]|nr:hypothetical protein BD560DRAFT_428590 [Blakeslea trispora]
MFMFVLVLALSFSKDSSIEVVCFLSVEVVKLMLLGSLQSSIAYISIYLSVLISFKVNTRKGLSVDIIFVMVTNSSYLSNEVNFTTKNLHLRPESDKKFPTLNGSFHGVFKQQKIKSLKNGQNLLKL